LAAAFAANGVEIVASDMPEDLDGANLWIDSDQHAASLDKINADKICPDELFKQKTRFRVVDMNNVPDDLVDFDFCWSACAIDHLGTIDKGLYFVKRSIDCLKPGGVAVHTTELNRTSDDETLDEGMIVLYRRKDFVALADELTREGHWVEPLDLTLGQEPVDRYIDVHPFRPEPHLNIELGQYSTTSVGMIVQKRMD
jgi:hypothetical protein